MGGIVIRDLPLGSFSFLERSPEINYLGVLNGSVTIANYAGIYHGVTFGAGFNLHGSLTPDREGTLSPIGNLNAHRMPSFYISALVPYDRQGNVEGYYLHGQMLGEIGFSTHQRDGTPMAEIEIRDVTLNLTHAHGRTTAFFEGSFGLSVAQQMHEDYSFPAFDGHVKIDMRERTLLIEGDATVHNLFGTTATACFSLNTTNTTNASAAAAGHFTRETTWLFAADVATPDQDKIPVVKGMGLGPVGLSGDLQLVISNHNTTEGCLPGGMHDKAPIKAGVSLVVRAMDKIDPSQSQISSLLYLGSSWVLRVYVPFAAPQDGFIVSLSTYDGTQFQLPGGCGTVGLTYLLAEVTGAQHGKRPTFKLGGGIEYVGAMGGDGQAPSRKVYVNISGIVSQEAFRFRADIGSFDVFSGPPSMVAGHFSVVYDRNFTDNSQKGGFVGMVDGSAVSSFVQHAAPHGTRQMMSDSLSKITTGVCPSLPTPSP